MAYMNCKWCSGRGCLACESEREKDKRKKSQEEFERRQRIITMPLADRIRLAESEMEIKKALYRQAGRYLSPESETQILADYLLVRGEDGIITDFTPTPVATVDLTNEAQTQKFAEVMRAVFAAGDTPETFTTRLLDEVAKFEQEKGK